MPPDGRVLFVGSAVHPAGDGVLSAVADDKRYPRQQHSVALEWFCSYLHVTRIGSPSSFFIHGGPCGSHLEAKYEQYAVVPSGPS